MAQETLPSTKSNSNLVTSETPSEGAQTTTDTTDSACDEQNELTLRLTSIRSNVTSQEMDELSLQTSEIEIRKEKPNMAMARSGVYS